MNIASALTAAARTGGIALLLFGPITGLVLNGYQVELHWERPLQIAVILAAVHLVVLLLAGRVWGRRLLWWFQQRSQPAARVVQERIHRSRILLLALTGVASVILPFFLSKYWLNVAIMALIYVLLGLGLNIVVGLAGLLDLGFVAFYAVGAYSYALGHQYLGLNFWMAIPFGATLAAGFGALLGFPVLRMHGDYLAIVTLGFGEIIHLILNNWSDFTGGPNGVKVPFPTLFGWEFSRTATGGGTTFHQVFGLDYAPIQKSVFLFFIILLVVIGLIWLVVRLRRMPIGRAWEALREDEIACRSLGINHVTVKLSAFSMGAMVGGIGGVFFAASQGFVTPNSFTFFESALILAMVVLGGMGSTVGVILAALVLTILPELLRDFAEYRILLFGLAMVAMMIWRPQGLLRSQRPAFALERPEVGG